MDTPLQCAICLDDIDCTSVIVTLNCSHKFHTSCFMENIKTMIGNRSNLPPHRSAANLEVSCPLCRDIVFSTTFQHHTIIMVPNTNEEQNQSSNISSARLLHLRYLQCVTLWGCILLLWTFWTNSCN